MGDGQIESGQREFELPFVVPGRAARQIDNFDSELRRFFAGASFVEWKQETAIGSLTGPNRAAGQRSSPEGGSCGQRDFQEIALIVSNGVARLNEDFSFAGDEHLIARFLDVGHQDRLRRVSGNLHAK